MHWKKHQLLCARWRAVGLDRHNRYNANSFCSRYAFSAFSLPNAMIRKIVLQNFMAHESTELHLADGLNVLVGPNNIGKSTIGVALKTLARNGNSSFVQRHDAKECSVIVTTSEGHTIQWQKKKSPSYIINGEVKDRLGRGGTPPELDETLRLAPVEFEDKDFEPHFGEQKSPIFLINRPPSQIAQFFSTTSDAERLVAMQRLHQRKKGDAQSQLKFLEDANQELIQQSEFLAPVPMLANMVSQLEEDLEQISRLDAESTQLLVDLENWKKGSVEASFQNQKRNSLDPLSTLPAFHDEMPLATFLVQMGTAERESEQTQTLATELSKVRLAPAMHATEPLKQLYEHLERVHQQHALGAIRSSCIANLVEPPEVLPEFSVANWVKEFEDLLQTAEQSRAQREELAGLQIPSQPSDTDSLQMLIDAMHSHLQASEALLSSQSKIDEESNRLDRLLADWLNANPTCPTCGTGLTMEMMRRRHVHAGESE
jgi:DNA repair exonuclease SbcCD ATPase subunit